MLKVSIGAAVVTAIMLWAASPVGGAGPLAWVALVPVATVVLSAPGTRAARLAVPLAYALYLELLLVPALPFGIASGQWGDATVPVMVGDSPVLAVALLAIPLFGALLYLIRFGEPWGAELLGPRLSMAAAVLVPALAWTGLDLLRAKLEPGGSWGPLFLSQVDTAGVGPRGAGWPVAGHARDRRGQLRARARPRSPPSRAGARPGRRSRRGARALGRGRRRALRPACRRRRGPARVRHGGGGDRAAAAAPLVRRRVQPRGARSDSRPRRAHPARSARGRRDRRVARGGHVRRPRATSRGASGAASDRARQRCHDRGPVLRPRVAEQRGDRRVAARRAHEPAPEAEADVVSRRARRRHGAASRSRRRP